MQDFQTSPSKVPAPLKVLIVISNLSHGGAERQVIELSNRISHESIELHICSLSNHVPLAKLLHSTNNLHVIPKKTKYDLKVIYQLTKLLKKQKFDVVHGFLFDAEIASRVAGFLANTKAIVGSERNSNNSFTALKRHIYKHTSYVMRLCIANSNAGAEFSQKQFGIPKQKYKVIHNGVDVGRFQARDSRLNRSEFEIPNDVKVIGMIGSFKRQKNHTLLLHAAALLKAKIENFRILFVGSKIEEGSDQTETYYEEVHRLVDELDVRHLCIFLEARNDVEEVYTLCDITVLPSLFEGTPNVALESMACGVPVIATDVADNKTMIPDGTCGFIVPLDQPLYLAEKIHLLLTNEKVRSQMAIEARSWVTNQFGLDEMAKNYEIEYKNLNSAKKGR